jgi:hypothetical protein
MDHADKKGGERDRVERFRDKANNTTRQHTPTPTIRLGLAAREPGASCGPGDRRHIPSSQRNTSSSSVTSKSTTALTYSAEEGPICGPTLVAPPT